MTSRTEAQRAIDAGLVRVGTNAEPKASTLVAADEPLHLESSPEPFVSRAGRKLEAGFDAFGVDPKGRQMIDVGASTGGFTDCALQRGAAHVVAVDVGYGQMHWEVRSDDRVTVVERTNIRTADPAALGAPFDLVVADLSFISLAMISQQLTALGSDHSDWLLLIKPQFEAGKGGVGKGGIVRDPGVRLAAIASVAEAFAENDLALNGLIVSPITGTTGNVEYVAWFKHGEPEQDVAALIDALEEAAP